MPVPPRPWKKFPGLSARRRTPVEPELTDCSRCSREIELKCDLRLWDFIFCFDCSIQFLNASKTYVYQWFKPFLLRPDQVQNLVLYWTDPRTLFDTLTRPIFAVRVVQRNSDDIGKITYHRAVRFWLKHLKDLPASEYDNVPPGEFEW